MKLYVDANGHWTGTQADAKRDAAGEEWDAREVPTDKTGLIAWLNSYQPVSAFTPSPEEMEDVREVVADAIVEVAVDARAKAEHNMNVEDEIANASFSDAIRLAEHVNHRVLEHVRYAANVEKRQAALKDALS
jgi:selenophosphate synthetase-related protein